MLSQNSSDLQHQRNIPNLYLYCSKNYIYLLSPQHLQEGEEESPASADYQAPGMFAELLIN